MMIFVNKKYTVQLVCVTLIMCSSGELLVDSPENSSVTEVANFNQETPDFHSVMKGISVPRNSSIERWNHSRMLLKSTTLGYDDWWFLTTPRTPISYKDFPGRPGVATWKEINPGENRDSRKLKAEASSNCWKLSSDYLWLFIVFYITFENFFQHP